MKTSDEELTKRTIKIIEAHGRILLKRDDPKYLGFPPTPRYLSGWTNIAAGPDNASWGRRNVAIEFFNLKWARTIAPLYNCKVVVVYPKVAPIHARPHPDRKTINKTIGEAMKSKYGLTDVPAKNKSSKKLPRNKPHAKAT